jgi:hypothetical protein
MLRQVAHRVARCCKDSHSKLRDTPGSDSPLTYLRQHLEREDQEQFARRVRPTNDDLQPLGNIVKRGDRMGTSSFRTT